MSNDQDDQFDVVRQRMIDRGVEEIARQLVEIDNVTPAILRWKIIRVLGRIAPADASEKVLARIRKLKGQ